MLSNDRRIWLLALASGSSAGQPLPYLDGDGALGRVAGRFCFSVNPLRMLRVVSLGDHCGHAGLSLARWPGHLLGKSRWFHGRYWGTTAQQEVGRSDGWCRVGEVTCGGSAFSGSALAGPKQGSFRALECVNPRAGSGLTVSPGFAQGGQNDQVARRIRACRVQSSDFHARMVSTITRLRRR